MGVYRSKFANRINYPVRLLSLEGACQYLSCRGDLLEELIALGDVPVIRLGPEPRGKRDRIAAQSNIFPEIRARQIVLVDEKGKPRCILAMGKEGPGLAMSDENGEMRSILKIDADGTRLSLYDGKGEPRAVLNAGRDGSGLALYDDKGNPRAGLFVGKDGPKLTLFDKKGKEQWSTPSGK